MAQIQYTPLAFAPTLTPPTIPQVGWRPSAPDSTRRASLPTSAIPSIFRAESLENWAPVLMASVCAPASTRRSALSAAALATSTVFRGESLENWAPTLGPDTSPVYTTRSAPRTVAGLTAGVSRAESVEQFVPPALSWRGIAPDVTRRAVLSTAAAVSASAYTDRNLVVAAPPLSWAGSWPDTTRRAALGVSQMPASIAGPAIEQWAIPTLSWVPQLVDVTRRAVLPTALQLATITGTAPENWSVPPLAWAGHVPPQSLLLRMRTRSEDLSFALQGLLTAAPALSWQPLVPDSTRRAQLTVAQQLVTFGGQALEQWVVPPLGWLGIGPDALRRTATLRVDSVNLLDVADTTPLAWAASLPVSVARAARRPDALAWVTVPAAVPPLAWAASVPDVARGTWRLNVGPSVAFVPVVLYSSQGSTRRTILVTPRGVTTTIDNRGAAIIVPPRNRTEPL